MYSISSGLKLEFLSYYNEDFAAFENNYAGYIMTDYRRISSREGALAENKDHRHSLTLKYSEPLSGFFTCGNVQYWGRWSNIMYGTEFIGNLSNIQSYAIDNKSNGYSITGKISKYFDALSSTFDLGTGFNEYWMTFLRQGVLINTDTKAPSVNFACISNIGKKIKTKYDITYSHFKTIYDGSSSPSPIDALHQILSAEYQIVPRVILKMSGEHYFNSAVASGSRHIPFLDGSLIYRAKKCDINLEARNILNTTDYGGVTYMYPDGTAVAVCPRSNEPYPYDFRGLIQHEAGGHGFGKLGDEYIYYNAFIQGTNDEIDFMVAKSFGWFDNLSLDCDINSVPWSHMIMDPKYSDTVDIYEGGYFYNRGVFRSEASSCMNKNIPYYSAISREAIVKRIMLLAGEEYSYEVFKENDSVPMSPTTSTKAGSGYYSSGRLSNHRPPVIMDEKPNIIDNK